MPSTNPKSGLRPFAPMRFGRYTLLAPLATGGMAQVFLARTTGVQGFEKLVVIKKILPHLAEDSIFVDRFLDEGKIVVKLHHGSIAQVIDMGREGDEYYIAMEFVDGKDLRKVAARCRDQKALLPTGLGLFIFVRLLDALAYAHRKKDENDQDLNLVHRDISPQNILVSYEGEVKIIDFGLAKSALSLSRTSPSVILGKFFYMSPEQARHLPADRRSDLYAAGISLWELLAGRNPFDEVPPGEILRAVANPSIPPLKDVCPDVPDALNDVVMRALAPDPADRFQVAEEMRGRLMASMLEIDPAAGPEALATFMRERFEREYDNERKTIAVLTKLPPPPEPGSAADGDADREGPPPDEATRRVDATSLRPPAARSDAKVDRDVTNTDPEGATELGGDRPAAPQTGPVFGGAAGTAPRRASSPRRPAAKAAEANRATIKFDPLEFVPGQTDDFGPPPPPRREQPGKPPEEKVKPRPPTSPGRAAIKAAPEPEVDRDPHPTPAEPPTAAELAASGTLTPKSIVVGPDLAAEPEHAAEEGKVLVSPELMAPSPDGPPTPATPLGLPIFSPDLTPRGLEVEPAPHGHSTATIVLVVVGVALIALAAIIGLVVFRPSWLGMAAPHSTPKAVAPAPEPEPPPPEAPQAAAEPTHPPQAPHAPAPAKPAAPVKDESVVEPPPDGPFPTKSTKTRQDLERSFNELTASYDALREKYPVERIAQLTSVHVFIQKKRDLLAYPARYGELEVQLRWYDKALSATRRRLQK